MHLKYERPLTTTKGSSAIQMCFKTFNYYPKMDWKSKSGLGKASESQRLLHWIENEPFLIGSPLIE